MPSRQMSRLGNWQVLMVSGILGSKTSPIDMPSKTNMEWKSDHLKLYLQWKMVLFPIVMWIFGRVHRKNSHVWRPPVPLGSSKISPKGELIMSGNKIWVQFWDGKNDDLHQVILCDLFGMVRWPIGKVDWLTDLQLGNKKVTLNYLALVIFRCFSWRKDADIFPQKVGICPLEVLRRKKAVGVPPDRGESDVDEQNLAGDTPLQLNC